MEETVIEFYDQTDKSESSSDKTKVTKNNVFLDFKRPLVMNNLYSMDMAPG